MADKGGLEGVVAAKSGLCYIDGVKGYLSYRGIDIFELAKHSTFEETGFLLTFGYLPTKEELDKYVADIKANRELPADTTDVLDAIADRAEPMEALRTAVSTLSVDDVEKDDNSHDANLRKANRLTARIATIIGYYEARRVGREPIESDISLNHAANLLYLITGKQPTELEAHVFDQALILHADHELPASTFAARVIAATLSDMYSAITGAVGALKGPLHGGANQKVMEMLEEMGSVDAAEPWVLAAFERKERLMGFGHRVYKTYDPRAKILKELAADLAKSTGDSKWYDMSVIVERVVMEQKGLYPNVDFYAASVYRMLGIPTELFTMIFAASRIVGWTSHVVEQHDDNRLIRPTSEYTGAKEAPYAKLEDRRVPAHA
ncbi:MAG: citrate synthase [Thermoleophilia bacterium]|nr:citrate synthase [Thermoleophilia bacterium]